MKLRSRAVSNIKISQINKNKNFSQKNHYFSNPGLRTVKPLN